MGRSSIELLHDEPAALTGLHDMLMIRSELADWQGHFDPHPSTAALLVVDPDATTRRRLRALSGAFMSGQSTVCNPQTLDEAANILTAREGTIVDLVVCAKEMRPGDLNRLLPRIARGICLLVTGQPYLEEDDNSCGPEMVADGVVREFVDPIGAGVAVFQMVASLRAPETLNCMDHEDLLAIFRPGSQVQLAEGIWFDLNLHWSVKARQVLAHTKYAALLMDCGPGFASMSVPELIVPAVKRCMAPNGGVLWLATEDYLCPLWATNGRAVNVLCALSSDERYWCSEFEVHLRGADEYDAQTLRRAETIFAEHLVASVGTAHDVRCAELAYTDIADQLERGDVPEWDLERFEAEKQQWERNLAGATRAGLRALAGPAPGAWFEFVDSREHLHALQRDADI